MDGATLQAKVYAGYSKAASRVGTQFDLYRPSSASNPLDLANWLSVLNAAFTVHGPTNFQFGTPSDYKNPLFHALIDGSQVVVGDYLVRENDGTENFAAGTFFIASMQPIAPILAVQCNRILTAWNPGPAHPIGLSGYGGTTPANETAIMTAWPASALLGARAVREKLLPEDVGYGAWRVLMPVWPGVSIRPGTILTDDLGTRMIVQAAELQDYGWRIDAMQAVT